MDVLDCCQVINFDSPRGGISLVTEKGPVTTSRLLIQKAIPSDTGLYTCDPSNANPASVRVHILNGKEVTSFPSIVELAAKADQYSSTLLGLLLYSQSQFLILREYHGLRVFENILQRRILGSQKEELTGE
jgi:hypothetical protein